MSGSSATVDGILKPEWDEWQNKKFCLVNERLTNSAAVFVLQKQIS